MPRRVSLPGASELFRSTGGVESAEVELAVEVVPVELADSEAAGVEVAGVAPDDPSVPEVAANRGTGRVRHDEKITVYVSAEELLALEQARLTIRARYRKAVDRGRIVREAVAAALADLEVNGADSELMRRLDPS